MKSLTAKALTTAAVLGAALLGTVGTSHAAELLDDGEKVIGVGYSTSDSMAIANAVDDAERQCASGWVNGSPAAKTITEKWINGWKATYITTCRSNGLSG